MQYLATEDFSDNQKRIISLRADSKTYNEIISTMQIHTGLSVYPRHISTCLQRSALGYHWDFGTENGSNPFLCKKDMTILSERVRAAQEEGCAFDTLEVLDESTRIKGERLAYGIAFLQEIKCLELAQKVADMAIMTPVRSWLNNVIDDLGAHIRSRRLIDQKRLEACSYTVIDTFFMFFGHKINETHPYLLFTADETMIQTKTKRKAVVHLNLQQVLEECYPDMPHITGMMCANVMGDGPPPMIILSELHNLPDELKIFTECGQMWVGSTQSGYMNRSMFTYWVVCFINWLSSYRLKLPPSLRECQVLLIMDGHTSRENPLALSLCRKARIEVLILPSHTTHVLQMFDVGLASPLKQGFSQRFKKELKKAFANTTLASNMAKFRFACISSFLDAWRCSCTRANCMSAAKATGIFPFDPTAPRNSVFVRDLRPDEQERYNARMRRQQSRLTINNQIITDPNFIVNLANEATLRNKFAFLCDIDGFSRKTYVQIITDLLHADRNDANLLTPIPPLFSPLRSPIFFE